MLIKDSKHLTARSQALLFLLKADYYHSKLRDRTILSRALYPELSEHYARQRLNTLISQFKAKGWISMQYKESAKLVKLTKHGELEALFTKAQLPHKNKWDGKWRLVMFDIPEDARHIRDKLRTLLKQFGFKALQASVYVSPYPLNSESITYLTESKLIRYIRILRVDQFDNQQDLLKLFKLT